MLPFVIDAKEPKRKATKNQRVRERERESRSKRSEQEKREETLENLLQLQKKL